MQSHLRLNIDVLYTHTEHVTVTLQIISYGQIIRVHCEPSLTNTFAVLVHSSSYVITKILKVNNLLTGYTFAC